MNIFKQTCAGALAVIFGATSVAPTMAAPMNLERPMINQNVEQIRDNRRPHVIIAGIDQTDPVTGTAIAATGTIAVAIVAITTAGGIPLPLSARAPSLVALSANRARSIARHECRTRMYAGAITATDLIALRIIRSSPITGREGSATRHITAKKKRPSGRF